MNEKMNVKFIYRAIFFLSLVAFHRPYVYVLLILLGILNITHFVNEKREAFLLIETAQIDSIIVVTIRINLKEKYFFLEKENCHHYPYYVGECAR